MRKFSDLDIDDLREFSSEAGRDAIKLLEGNLIEAQVLRDSVLPPWNKISGGKEGKENAKAGHEHLVALASRGEDSMVAKVTLTEIAVNPKFQLFEKNLHAARFMQLILGAPLGRTVSLQEAIQKIVDLDTFGIKREIFSEMHSSGYSARLTPFSP